MSFTTLYKSIKDFCIRLWLNKGAIGKGTLSIVGTLYTIWGFISLFEPLDGLFGSSVTGWHKFLMGLVVLVFVTALSFIVSSVYCLKSKCTHILSSNSGRNVYVKFGDMYSPDIVDRGYNERINLVIPVNRCFDTIVDDSLISHRTQHGRVMQGLYNKGVYNAQTLDDAIQQSLSREFDFVTLLPQDKPEGNLKRYCCGTVAEIKESETLTYFFLGLSKFDNMLKASTTKAEFAEAIQKLIEFCNERSQGYPVVLPLMGTGLSRTNIPATEVLKYIVSAFRINKDIINCDFHIVVWDGMKDKVSIKNL